MATANATRALRDGIIYAVRALILSEDLPSEGWAWAAGEIHTCPDWDPGQTLPALLEGVTQEALNARPEGGDTVLFLDEPHYEAPVRGLRHATFHPVNLYQWRDGLVRELEVTYKWPNGQSDNQVRLLIGVFPRRHQGQSLYGGAPMMADVLPVMSRWHLSQGDAIALMHEEA